MSTIFEWKSLLQRILRALCFICCSRYTCIYCDIWIDDAILVAMAWWYYFGCWCFDATALDMFDALRLLLSSWCRTASPIVDQRCYPCCQWILFVVVTGKNIRASVLWCISNKSDILWFHFDKQWTLCGSFMIITSPNEKKLEKTATQACIMSKMLANADK